MHHLRITVMLVLALTVAACGPDDDSSDACSNILAGELVITEVFADHDAAEGGSGADDGKEWFEIYNSSGAAINLEGITVLHTRPDGSRDNSHTMRSLTIGAGEYAVLGNVLPEFVEGHLDYGYAADLGDMFNTDGGKLALGCGDEVIDEALYDVVETGRSNGFDGGAPPDYTANDDLALWCTTPDETSLQFEENNYGTPGAGNFDCQGGIAGMCNDGGVMRPTIVPAVGDLVITEAMPSPTTPQELKEWIEVYAVAGFDLNGLQIARANGDSDTIAADDCLEVEADTYLVFAKTMESASNGMLPQVDAVFDFVLVEDARILDAAGNIIDAVTFTGAGSGDSFQLDPDFRDVANNDMERYWCDSLVAWAGGDLGSPGEANAECTILPAPGECTDPDTATNRPIVSPAEGQLVITELHPNPDGSDNEQEWVELFATVAVDLNGLKLQRVTSGTSQSTLTSSDCLEVDAQSYALLTRVGATHVPAATATYGTVTLPDTCTAPTCDLRIVLGDNTLIDKMTWTDADGTIAGGLSARQLDDGLVGDAGGNDAETSWCDATTAYNDGKDNGTPGAANISCD